MDLSIIIVTHNSSAPVERCLASLERFRPSCSHETIVVDNSSTDGTVEKVRSAAEWARVIANPDNRGYSRGVNQGIRASQGRYVLILNPDIEVTEGSIDALTGFMDERPDAGMAGAKLLYPDGTLQHSCRSFYTLQALFLRRTFFGKLFPRARALREHLLLDYDHAEAREVDWLIGACLIVRREALDGVGLMDERFFLYFEDTDWCYRMHQHGWRVWYVPGSVMTHTYERSSARSVLRKPFLLHMLSLLRYYEKWARFFNLFRKYRGAIKSLVFVTSDLVAINAAFLAAYFLRGAFQPLFVNRLYPLDWYAYFIAFYNLIFFMTFLLGGLYSIRRDTPPSKEMVGVARAVLMTFAVLLGATYLTRIRIYSRAVLLGQAAFTVLTVSASRALIRKVHAQLVRASFDLKRVVVAGTHGEADEMAAAIAASRRMGMDVVGRVGEGEDALGGLADLGSVIERFKIQEVIVMPSCLEDGTAPLAVVSAVTKMTGVRMATPAARFMGGGMRVEKAGGHYMFSLEGGAQQVLLRTLSRCVDLAAGIVMTPVSLFLNLLVRSLSIPGRRPSFFTEERQGRHSRAVRWPRGTRRGGKEVSDLVKPRLWAGLLTGRLALVGVPAPRPGSEMLSGWSAGFRPGITGRWRSAENGDWGSAFMDEVLDQSSRKLSGYIEILINTSFYIFSGRYPRWFFSKERER